LNDSSNQGSSGRGRDGFRRGQSLPARPSEIASHGHARAIPLKQIDVGETDANAEYFIAKRAKTEPMFQRAYYEQSTGFSEELNDGHKFIIYGQKGTGKTAILRHLEFQS